MGKTQQSKRPERRTRRTTELYPQTRRALRRLQRLAARLEYELTTVIDDTDLDNAAQTLTAVLLARLGLELRLQHERVTGKLRRRATTTINDATALANRAAKALAQPTAAA